MKQLPFRAGLVIAVAIVFLCGLLASATAQAPETSIKLGVVNLDFLVAQSPGGKALQKRLAAFQAKIQAEGEAKAKAAQEIRKRIQDGAPSLSEDKLAALQKQYEDAMIAVRRFQDAKRREGEKMRAEGLREIEKQLQPAFKKVSDKQGYDLILNNVGGVVVMASEKIDMTHLVLAELEATAK